MTCELGLRGYMICTECHSIFTENEIEIGEMFNCSPDTSVVCSEKCREKITEKVSKGDWMTFDGYSETISE